ncbi:hypothetical protein BKA62DRAFT_672191 [Auriculariales sp. MPI-PUGE-AT-0066]|nr:hypothetical protein BKA62DRAFT_672191 [Auriculariales sp. MPI-PUGE-AT-0066]
MTVLSKQSVQFRGSSVLESPQHKFYPAFHRSSGQLLSTRTYPNLPQWNGLIPSKPQCQYPLSSTVTLSPTPSDPKAGGWSSTISKMLPMVIHARLTGQPSLLSMVSSGDPSLPVGEPQQATCQKKKEYSTIAWGTPSEGVNQSSSEIGYLQTKVHKRGDDRDIYTKDHGKDESGGMREAECALALTNMKETVLVTLVLVKHLEVSLHHPKGEDEWVEREVGAKGFVLEAMAVTAENLAVPFVEDPEGAARAVGVTAGSHLHVLTDQLAAPALEGGVEQADAVAPDIGGCLGAWVQGQRGRWGSVIREEEGPLLVEDKQVGEHEQVECCPQAGNRECVSVCEDRGFGFLLGNERGYGQGAVMSEGAATVGAGFSVDRGHRQGTIGDVGALVRDQGGR